MIVDHEKCDRTLLWADALRIGYCVIEDANVWPYCTGGGNQHMGTATEVGSNGCQAGEGGGVVVECGDGP